MVSSRSVIAMIAAVAICTIASVFLPIDQALAMLLAAVGLWILVIGLTEIGKARLTGAFRKIVRTL